MTSYLELLADGEYGAELSSKGGVAWPANAHLVWQTVGSDDALKTARASYLNQVAIENPNKHGKGRATRVQCDRSILLQSGMHTVGHSAALALDGLPALSARLLLTFDLLQPLLSADDAPLYVVDNPVRKDPVLMLPYLSAAAVKGLSADAYRRAFPPSQPAEDENAYRRSDDHALHLFGIADDGAELDGPGSMRGRMQFSPVWFDQIEYLVMNPQDTQRSIGTTPIPFEAVARGQSATIEVLYINPFGACNSEEHDVRTHTARWLGALAQWWPAIGIGAKRLASYGAIEPVSVQLQAVGWTDNATVSEGIEVSLDDAGGEGFTGTTRPLLRAHVTGDDSWMRLAYWIARAELVKDRADGK